MNIQEQTEYKKNTDMGTGDQLPTKKNGTLRTVRTALIVFIALTAVCGILYPVAVTIISQALFPYEANGSLITVQMKDGSSKTYGSTLIGQQFSDPVYLAGRINPGAPSNLSPSSAEYRNLIEQRRDTFTSGGYSFTGDIPAELVTVSGSGLDPHVSSTAAEYQVKSIVQARNAAGWKLADNDSGTLVPFKPENTSTADTAATDSTPNLSNFTEEYVRSVITKHTEKRFLGVFGEPRVNVLLVNLTLDGIL